MKVEQFLHANQFHIYDNDNDLLQSYNSLVVRVNHSYNNKVVIVLGRDWDYSKTTTTHVYAFLEKYAGIYIPHTESNKRKYIQKMIDNGKIIYNENMF